MIGWYRNLLKSPSLARTYFYLLATLSFVYVLQVSLLSLSIRWLGGAPFSLVKSLVAIACVYSIVFVFSLLLSSLASILACKMSLMFSEKSGFVETRLLIACWLICMTPIGFFRLLSLYADSHPGMGGAKAMGALSLVGISILVIYAWIVMVRGLAEVHQISLSRAFVASLAPMSMFSQHYLIA